MSVIEAKTAPVGSRQRSKVVKPLWLIAGSVCLVFGLVGIVVPILPTTPFLLAVAACFLKSSKRAHNWLLTNRVFGEYLKNYKEGKGVSIKNKLIIGILLWTTITISAISVNVLYAQAVLVIVATVVTLHIIMLPTLKT